MFEGFSQFNLLVSSEPEVIIHGIKSGNGPPLLLLHGFPQTHHMWHLVASKLNSTHTVVCIDLRGYGQSSKPTSSSSTNHAPFAKSAMAKDCVAVMSQLGFEDFSVLAHDRGARVAHKLCVDFPERVHKAMLLDICPTLEMFEKTTQLLATFYWHWFFLIQPEPFPETLILSNLEQFQARFFGVSGYAGKLEYHHGAMRAYLEQLVDKDAVHSMCEDYRAAATVDLKEAREDRAVGRRIKCPLRVLWGKNGAVGRCFDTLAEWRAVSDGSVEGEAVDSGHYVAEEVPEVVLNQAKAFFGSG
jgi:haloacetate dehalogenase